MADFDPTSVPCTHCGNKFTPRKGVYGFQCPHCKAHGSVPRDHSLDDSFSWVPLSVREAYRKAAQGAPEPRLRVFGSTYDSRTPTPGWKPPAQLREALAQLAEALLALGVQGGCDVVLDTPGYALGGYEKIQLIGPGGMTINVRAVRELP